jgi:hypothetical protein
MLEDKYYETGQQRGHLTAELEEEIDALIIKLNDAGVIFNIQVDPGPDAKGWNRANIADAFFFIQMLAEKWVLSTQELAAAEEGDSDQ